MKFLFDLVATSFGTGKTKMPLLLNRSVVLTPMEFRKDSSRLFLSLIELLFDRKYFLLEF